MKKSFLISFCSILSLNATFAMHEDHIEGADFSSQSMVQAKATQSQIQGLEFQFDTRNLYKFKGYLESLELLDMDLFNSKEVKIILEFLNRADTQFQIDDRKNPLDFLKRKDLRVQNTLIMIDYFKKNEKFEGENTGIIQMIQKELIDRAIKQVSNEVEPYKNKQEKWGDFDERILNGMLYTLLMGERDGCSGKLDVRFFDDKVKKLMDIMKTVGFLKSDVNPLNYSYSLNERLATFKKKNPNVNILTIAGGKRGAADNIRQDHLTINLDPDALPDVLWDIHSPDLHEELLKLYRGKFKSIHDESNFGAGGVTFYTYDQQTNKCTFNLDTMKVMYDLLTPGGQITNIDSDFNYSMIKDMEHLGFIPVFKELDEKRQVEAAENNQKRLQELDQLKKEFNEGFDSIDADEEDWSLVIPSSEKIEVQIDALHISEDKQKPSLFFNLLGQKIENLEETMKSLEGQLFKNPKTGKYEQITHWKKSFDLQ